MKRRDFIKFSAVSGLGITMGENWKNNFLSVESEKNANPICIFSKHLDWMDFRELGAFAKKLGFDGVDLTVRKKGHVLPYEVEEQLPKAIEEITKSGVAVPMIATDIHNADEPYTERVLKTASQCGIKIYRIEYSYFDKNISIEENLEIYKDKFKKLSELNEKYGIHGAYQNHDGVGRIGASIWDLWYLIKDLDPKWIGVQFDIRHAIVEGSSSWPNDLKLIQKFIKCSAVKDFHWTQTNKREWEIKNVPLEEGMVNFDQYFDLYKAMDLAGPISLHLPYLTYKGITNKQEKELLAKATMKKDLTTIKARLKIKEMK
ncbi:sugar phosphate isomerase/epimerase family protein [Flexithrix dorotheae]|uniref:sugar phosphate isomerase/epimerase family protein n=1 Tax=Flexithrix dorotheae TaxID=70993 RepID=UPI000370D52A|nr:sugar phosphate isomerase/epimerase family protein [Flexithrix dorotheae]